MKLPAMLAVTLATLLLNSGATAQYLWQAREAEDAAKAAPRLATAVPPRSTGLTVFIDPTTGAMRPPEHEEMRELDRAARAIADAERPVVLINGTGGAQGVLLNRSFDSYFVARRGADGALNLSCIPGEADATRALLTLATPAGMVQKKAMLDEK